MRRAPLIFLLLVTAAALTLVSAPWFAFRAVQSAARDGDVQALAELIDYPAVRAGLRTGASPESVGPAPDVWRDPMGAMRRALIPQPPAPPSMERHLTPQGLAAITGPPGLFPTVRHWGPNRVRFAHTSEEGESRFTFQRRGVLRWQLVHVGVPPVSATFR
ncbi:DUF2939 domain-containing protein [Phenylobacterium sp.]|uniref:DUF2939 domain-containing protein n=1 Tax=Phenylobacterium sp. TaxID=1871053 RepID=UPI00398338A4